MNAYQIVQNITSRAAEIRADELPPRQHLAKSVAVQSMQVLAALARPGAYLYFNTYRKRWAVSGCGVCFMTATVKALERQGRLRGHGVVLTLA
jgi:hypothetical protein